MVVNRRRRALGVTLTMQLCVLRYKCIICMPQVPSMYERYILCRKFGCEVHLTSVDQAAFVR